MVAESLRRQIGMPGAGNGRGRCCIVAASTPFCISESDDYHRHRNGEINATMNAPFRDGRRDAFAVEGHSSSPSLNPSVTPNKLVGNRPANAVANCRNFASVAVYSAMMKNIELTSATTASGKAIGPRSCLPLLPATDQNRPHAPRNANSTSASTRTAMLAPANVPIVVFQMGSICRHQAEHEGYGCYAESDRRCRARPVDR